MRWALPQRSPTVVLVCARAIFMRVTLLYDASGGDNPKAGTYGGMERSFLTHRAILVFGGALFVTDWKAG